jgi:NADH-quinone oxidoreductase subunit N/multicomponent Na+:H+ antiporter subunit D
MRAELAIIVPLFIALGGVVTYIFAKLLTPRSRRWTGSFTALWFLSAFVLLLFATMNGTEGGVVPFSPLLNVSYLGITIGLLATGIGALAALASQDRIDPDGPVQLYYPLLLFALAGTAAAGFCTDLFTLFVIVELSSIPSYTLVAYRYREDPRALAAAVKYLVQGVAGTITALMGVALLYLSGHTLAIAELPRALAGADPLITGLAAVLILIGYGVKLGIVPMHTWLPDTYVLAPAGVTAILTGATKAGVLIALFLSLSALPANTAVPAFTGGVICVLAVITMTVGNLLALNQPDLRRVLAYSSVAQMGYILLGFGIGVLYNLPLGVEAGLFYVIAYGVMKAGAFLAADQFMIAAGSPETSRMRGLGARYPLLGSAFAIFILGLIGMPATVGFLGKLLVFEAGVVASTPVSIALALVLIANTAISLGYYVPILSTLLFDGTEPAAKGLKVPVGMLVSVIALAIITVYLGIFAQTLMSWIVQASPALLPPGVP